MKQLIIALFATSLLVGFTGCKEQYTTYSDAEYVMFADTMSIYMVEEKDYFSVPIASTVARDYDRTFGVEIIDQGSNAIERLQYRLLSNSVTIKAGELSADVRVKGYYENIKMTDSLGFILSLITPPQLQSNLYTKNIQTKVVMMKGCPFDIDNFTGWCMVTSSFLYQYPIIGTTTYQRLIKTEKHPSEPNKIIMRDWLYDGYDVTLNFDASNLEKPILTMDKDQVLGDEESVFGIAYGDNKLRGTHSSGKLSYFNSCQHYASLWIRVYITNLGESSGIINNGIVGDYTNAMEWVSDEEAARLQREEGF